jgi:hypothetical protein
MEYGYLDGIVSQMIKQNHAERPGSILDVKRFIQRRRLSLFSGWVIPILKDCDSGGDSGSGANLIQHGERGDSPVTRFVTPDVAEALETRDLLRPEFREHLIAALFYRGHDRIMRRVARASCFELYHVGSIKAWSGGLYYASVKFGQSRELANQHMIVEGLHVMERRTAASMFRQHRLNKRNFLVFSCSSGWRHEQT